jgi:hypothetical protein
MEKSPRLQNFEANKAAHEEAVRAAEYDEAVRINEEFDANKEAEKDAFEDKVYGTFDDPENLATRERAEDANAYERHLERVANGVDRQEEIFNKPSAALKRDAAMYDEALAMNEAFDTERHETAQAEAKKADAAFEAKLAASPKLRRMDMISQEVHNLNNEIAALNNSTDLENEAEISAKIDALKERRGELDVKLLELVEEYKKDDTYDKNIENVLLDRSDMASLDEAAKIALSEEREVEQKTVEAAQQVENTEPEAETVPEPEEAETAAESEPATEDEAETSSSEDQTDNPVVREIQKGLAQRVQDINNREKQADTSSVSQLSPLSIGQPVNYEQVAVWERELGRSLAPMDGVINRDVLVANEARKRALREQLASESAPTVASEEVSEPATGTNAPARESWTEATKENFKDAGRWIAATFWKNRRWGAERPQDSQSAGNGERRLSKRWRGRAAIGAVTVAALFVTGAAIKNHNKTENVDTGFGKVATAPRVPGSSES